MIFSLKARSGFGSPGVHRLSTLPNSSRPHPRCLHIMTPPYYFDLLLMLHHTDWGQSFHMCSQMEPSDQLPLHHNLCRRVREIMPKWTRTLSVSYLVSVSFHTYLYGRKFMLIMDHKPLTTILGPKKGVPAMTAARLQR